MKLWDHISLTVFADSDKPVEVSNPHKVFDKMSDQPRHDTFQDMLFYLEQRGWQMCGVDNKSNVTAYWFKRESAL